jgi:hypothetical protein
MYVSHKTELISASSLQMRFCVSCAFAVGFCKYFVYMRPGCNQDAENSGAHIGYAHIGANDDRRAASVETDHETQFTTHHSSEDRRAASVETDHETQFTTQHSSDQAKPRRKVRPQKLSVNT